jgi:hypothetical protein
LKGRTGRAKQIIISINFRFSLNTPVSSTNKIDCHDIPEILLKVALNNINQPTNPLIII